MAHSDAGLSLSCLAMASAKIILGRKDYRAGKFSSTVKEVAVAVLCYNVVHFQGLLSTVGTRLSTFQRLDFCLLLPAIQKGDESPAFALAACFSATTAKFVNVS